MGKKKRIHSLETADKFTIIDENHYYTSTKPNIVYFTKLNDPRSLLRERVFLEAAIFGGANR